MEKTKLKNFITQIRGVSYKPKDISEEATEDHIGLLRADALQKNNILFDNLIYVHKDRVKKDQILRKGDILVATSSGSIDVVGKTAQFIFSKNPVTLGAFCKILRPSNVDPSFIKYFFQTRYYKQTIRHLAAGANINNIRTNDLDNLDIYIFSKEYQELASKILGNVENLIKNRKEQIQAYDDLIESLFFEMFGNPITNSKHFKTNKFINVVRLKRGYDLPVKSRVGNKYEVYGSNGVLDGHNEFKVEEAGVITGRSGTIGKVFRNEGMYWPLNTTLYSEKTYGNNVIFLEYLLKNFKLDRFATGTGVPTLNRNIVHKEEIIEVPIELQNKFADYVLKIEEEKKKLNSSLLDLENLFDSLMENAFSGNLFKD